MGLRLLTLTLALVATTFGAATAAPQELEEGVRKIENVISRVHDLDRISQAQAMAYRGELAEAGKRIAGYNCDNDVRHAGERLAQAQKELRAEDHQGTVRRIVRDVESNSRAAIDLIRRSPSWRHEGCRGGREGGVHPREGDRPWGKGNRGGFVADYTVNGSGSYRGGIGHLTGQGNSALTLDVSPAPGDKCPIVNTIQIRQSNGQWMDVRVASRTNPGKNRYGHFAVPQGAQEIVISFADAQNARVKISLGD